jgi:hypothetical protein
VQLNADHGAKRIRSCEEHCAAHAGAEIDERVFVDGSERAAAAPAYDHSLKNRRSDGVIGRYMAVVAVSGSEMTPCDKAAGAYA